MQRRAVASRPPAAEEFRRHRVGSHLLLVAASFEESALELGLLEPGGLERRLEAASGPRGRGQTAVLPLAGRAERLHLRPLRHGGLLRGLLRDWLWGPGRPAAELRVTAELRARGAPLPRPVLVAARQRLGPLWNAAVGTVYEEETADAQSFLEGGPERRRILAAAAAAGHSVRRLHEAGGRHRDLHVKNLLVRCRDDEVEVLVVDLDRGRIGDPPGPGARMAEIMRLHRSLVKRGLADRVGSEGRECFLEAYTGGDRALRERLLAFLPRERRRLALHRIGHRLGLT